MNQRHGCSAGRNWGELFWALLTLLLSAVAAAEDFSV